MSIDITPTEHANEIARDLVVTYLQTHGLKISMVEATKVWKKFFPNLSQPSNVEWSDTFISFALLPESEA